MGLPPAAPVHPKSIRSALCPVHKIPDCSPLLNGCSRLTSPEGDQVDSLALAVRVLSPAKETLAELDAKVAHHQAIRDLYAAGTIHLPVELVEIR